MSATRVRSCGSFPAPARSPSFGDGPRSTTKRSSSVLMALAGPDGLATRLGDELVELECNPVLVTPIGAVALDARLILRDAPAAPRTAASDATSPACSRRARSPSPARRRRGAASATARSRRTARSGGATVSTRCTPTPRRSTAFARVADLAEIDAPIDYLLVAVPAARCAGRRTRHGGAGAVRARDQRRLRRGRCGGRGTERRAAGGRARGEDPRARPELHRCVQPRRAASVPAERAAAKSGNVSIVSQSGGLSGDIITGGTRRGVRYSKVLSVGNAIDVTPAEVLEWLVDDPDTGVIGLYLEGARGADRLLDALRRARPQARRVARRRRRARRVPRRSRRTPVHSPASGASGKRSRAPLASRWCTRSRTSWPRSRTSSVGGESARPDGDVLVVGVGGGASVLAADACDRAGLTLEPTIAGGASAVARDGARRGHVGGEPARDPVRPCGAGRRAANGAHSTVARPAVSRRARARQRFGLLRVRDRRRRAARRPARRSRGRAARRRPARRGAPQSRRRDRTRRRRARGRGRRSRTGDVPNARRGRRRGRGHRADDATTRSATAPRSSASAPRRTRRTRA